MSPVVTVTTTPQNFDNERFSLVSPSLLEDSGYDFRLISKAPKLIQTSASYKECTIFNLNFLLYQKRKFSLYK